MFPQDRWTWTRSSLAAGAAALVLTLVFPAEATAQQTRRAVLTELPASEQIQIGSEADEAREEADRLLWKAHAANEATRFRRAADLFRRSGELRRPGMKSGVAAFEQAGTAYFNADKPARASRAWEKAADRGLVRGDVFGGSQNFMRASMAAHEAGNRVRTSDMAWRAHALTRSPQLTEAERTELRTFIGSTSSDVADAGEAARPADRRMAMRGASETNWLHWLHETGTNWLWATEPYFGALHTPLYEAPESTPSSAQRATMTEKIHFAHDRSDLSSTAKAILRNKVSVFRAHPAMRITVTGHTSRPGSRANNMELGLRRAMAARDYLVAQGIEKGRINIATRGENDLAVHGPIADAQNRRGEFRILVTEITMTRD